MSLSPAGKKEAFAPYQRAANDTGSPEAQIALLTKEIELLTQHSQQNKKDPHSRLGLLKKVSKRRKLLHYLKRVNLAVYVSLIEKLGLRG